MPLRVVILGLEEGAVELDHEEGTVVFYLAYY
jgi:hypothetical protein